MISINFPHQQIRASDICRESQHEDLQDRLLDYHLKIIMEGINFKPPPIKFKGSTEEIQFSVKEEYPGIVILYRPL